MTGNKALFDSNVIIYLSRNEIPLSFVNQRIADITVDIRKNKRIKLPDAIISATAIAGSLQLVTRNVDDFSNIEVRITNPFD